MKNIIISFVFFLSIPILSANAGGKRPKAPCPDAVKEDTEIAQQCAGVTVVCPSVALVGSNISAICYGAAGITTLCPLYSDTPPPSGCAHITQPGAAYDCIQKRGDWINGVCVQPDPMPIPPDPMPIPPEPMPIPPYPAPYFGPSNPLPDGGPIPGSGGQGGSSEICSIINGAKSCKSCSSSDSYQPSYPDNAGNSAKEKKEQCHSCSITTERLVPRMGCKSDADCILVRGDCCDGCSEIAINKSQKNKYYSLLNKECNPPLKPGESRAQCACGSSYPEPKREAICEKTKWAIPAADKTCQLSEFYPRRPLPVPINPIDGEGITVGGGTTGSSVQ